MSPYIKLVCLIVTAMLLTGCNPSQPPVVSDIAVSNISGQSDKLIQVGSQINLSVTASGKDLRFEWTATSGSFSDPTKSSVIYTAPDSPGAASVTVSVTGGGTTVIKNTAFQVVAPTPSPMPDATVTLTPTFAPTLTSSPAFTNTPPPPPLVEIFPQVDGGEEFVFINQGGLLSNEFIPAQNCAHSGLSGLRLTYEMKGAGFGGWGVNWDNAPARHFDASGFATFTFWVRGASGGETFQIGLKDTGEKEVKVESKSLVLVTSDWLMATVPLSKFKGVNTASVRNVNFGFNKNHGSGSICIDDIAFAP